MPIREVSRSEDGGANERNLYEALPRPFRQEAHAAPLPWPGDTAEVTRPDQIALRLLRERVLGEAARALCVHARPGMHRAAPFLEPADPEAWASQLLQDLHLLLARAPLAPAEGSVRALFHQACQRGAEETLEILSGLDPEREPLVQARILAVAAALTARLTEERRD